MPAAELRGEPDRDRVLVGLTVVCSAAGAAVGLLVGWLFGRDEAQAASEIAVYAVAGVVAGAFLGLCASVGAIFVLVAVDGRRWASAPLVRAALAAAGAAVPVDVLDLVLSGFEPNLLVFAFCTAVTGLPAATAMLVLDLRWRRSSRSSSVRH